MSHQNSERILGCSDFVFDLLIRSLPVANDNLTGNETLCQGVLIDIELARRFPYSRNAKSGASDLSVCVLLPCGVHSSVLLRVHREPFMSRRSLLASRSKIS